MKKVFLLFSVVSLLFACNSSSNSNGNDYGQSEEDIIRMEKNFPDDNIEIYKSLKVQFNNKVEFSLELTNKATKVAYENITLRVTFYDSSNNELGNEIFYFDSYLEPTDRRTQTFKTQNKYKNTDDISVDVISADSYEL
ncbi:MAG: hypothetical protein JXR68_14240 [Bacteroidales bacterium]|nr:hypothetical protein [Bacteroidales bacterium]